MYLRLLVRWRHPLPKSGIIFGWAKPVPVNYNNLKHKKRDIILVASAGVAINFALAAISALLLKLSLLIPQNLLSGILATFFLNMIFFNTLLAVFNLLPIPPLDGSKILLGGPKINIYKNTLMPIVMVHYSS